MTLNVLNCNGKKDEVVLLGLVMQYEVFWVKRTIVLRIRCDQITHLWSEAAG